MSSNKRQKIEDGSEQIRKHQAALQDAVDAALSEKNEQIRALQAAVSKKDSALKAAVGMLCFSKDCVNFLTSSWADLPPEVRDDKTCVMQAIQHRHLLEKDDIPEHFRDDREIAMEAQKQGMGTWIEIRPTPDEWRGNANLSLLALRQGSIQDLADAPALTRDIVCQALMKKKLRWEHIPAELKNDPAFGRSVVGHSVEIAHKVFRRHPDLRQERALWEDILASNDFGIHELFHQEHAPNELLEDAEFMRNAIDKDFLVLEYVRPSLHTEITKIHVQANPETLAHVPRDFIETFPVFVKSQLAHFCRALSPNHIFSVEVLARKIPAGWWLNEFLNDWFLAGLPGLQIMLRDGNEEQWNSDRVKLLLVAKHCPVQDWKLRSLLLATEEVRNDPIFFHAAMDFDPCLFEAASDVLRAENFELAVRALSVPHFVARCRHAIANQGLPFRPRIILTNEAMEDFRVQAVQKLAMHDTFSTLLRFMYVSGEPLSHLNVREVKMLLAEFAGVPRGRRLTNIRQALTNLAANANGRR